MECARGNEAEAGEASVQELTAERTEVVDAISLAWL